MKNTTRVITTTMGTLMGLSGIMHGVGEILQGKTAPAGLVFPSWPDAPFFQVFNGEPAMSILPNLFATGVLAVLFSATYILCATVYIQKKKTGLIMFLLAIAMLLFGAGIFPPVLSMVIAIVGTRIHHPIHWPRRLTKNISSKALELGWKVCFVVCLLSWLALSPGYNFASMLMHIENEHLTMTILILALGSLGLTLLISLLKDGTDTSTGLTASQMNM